MALVSSGQLSLNDIRSELLAVNQVPFSLSGATMGFYVTLNNCSQYKPNTLTPYQISEWYSYCHTCKCNGFCLAYSATECATPCAEATGCTCCVNNGGFDNFVRDIQVDSNGKILVGGDFTLYSGASANNIIRLNANGTKDTSFLYGTGFSSGGVYVICVQKDGKIVVGGQFTQYSGVSANNIVRLNSGGTIDSSFSYGSGFVGNVFDIKQQYDGKLIVAGEMTSYSGGSIGRIVRLNSDGTKDSSYVTGSGFDNTVYKIALQNDDKVVAVGGFIAYSGISANRIIRLTTGGTKDSTFSYGGGFSGTTQNVKIQPNGKIVVFGGGLFYSGQPIQYVTRLNTDGIRDSTFPGTSGFTFSSGSFTALELQGDGKMIFGGTFTGYSGNSVTNIVRVTSGGTKDNSFTVSPGGNGQIMVIKQKSTGEILVGGGFTTYNGDGANYFVPLNYSGNTIMCPTPTPTPTPTLTPTPTPTLTPTPTPTLTPTPTPTLTPTPTPSVVDIFVSNLSLDLVETSITVNGVSATFISIGHYTTNQIGTYDIVVNYTTAITDQHIDITDSGLGVVCCTTLGVNGSCTYTNATISLANPINVDLLDGIC